MEIPGVGAAVAGAEVDDKASAIADDADSNITSISAHRFTCLQHFRRVISEP